MAPTICSEKKRESRTVLNTNIRRNGQGSHQLNQKLSNIVSYVAKGSLNSRISTSLRICSQSDKGHGETNQRQQQFSFLSDNAVTSSAHLDTENSFDLRLANETLANDSTPTYSSNTNPSSLSSPSPSTSPSLSSLATETEIASHNERISSSTSPYAERRFQRYLSTDSSSDNDVTDLYESNGDNKDSNTITKKPPSQIHSSNIRKNYFDCNDFDLTGDEDDEDDEEELNNHDIRSDGSDADMDTDEADSMTSLDTEKSAKLKRGNRPLLRDKLLVKHQTDDNNRADNYRKPLASIRSSTDGLLSIAIKTIKLVKRNQLLQQRLTQLQLETSEFIQSVLANPENRHFRENIKQCKRQEVDKV